MSSEFELWRNNIFPGFAASAARSCSRSAIMAFSIQLRGGAVIARGTDKIRDYGYDEHGNRGYQRQFVDPAQVNYTGRHGHLT